MGGVYIPHKNLAPGHFEKNCFTIDAHLNKYENIPLMDDFNCEMSELVMKNFCDTYNLSPTCFKNPYNPSCIDLILTNMAKSFFNTHVFETGLSDHHKMCITVSRVHLPKMIPNTITYRSYKHFKLSDFRGDLVNALSTYKNMDYGVFENIFLNILDKHATLKQKITRANESPFINKEIKKAIVKRTGLRNRYLRIPSVNNKELYKRQRNLCTSLIRKHKTIYYNNVDVKNICGNKKLWKIVKPLFSDKSHEHQNITLINDKTVISENGKMAEIFNAYFSTAAANLDLGTNVSYTTDTTGITDPIIKAITKYEKHPSIIKINEALTITDKFNFPHVQCENLQQIVNGLDVSKTTAYCSIPTEIFKQNFDIFSGIITDIYNNNTISGSFPLKLKFADFTPVHKKNDYTDKTNYRPVSLLPSVSKLFERQMSRNINSYIDKFLSHKLCAFRRNYSTQTSLIIMIEYIRKHLDKGIFSGMRLTDLSKAFDRLMHDLLIAKLRAYGFDYNALLLINNYLSDREQRTKIGESYSSWSNITLGVPQGSILGPLLFNIYINDLFYFVEETELTNNADDNTPYICDKSIDLVISRLEKDLINLGHWFKANYLKSNEDKWQLLLNIISADLYVMVGNESVYNSSLQRNC